MECVERKKWSLYLQTLFSERGVSVLPNWSLSKLGFYPPQKPRDETLSSLILWCDYVKGTAPRSWRKTVPGCKTSTKICSKLSSQRRKRKDVQFQQLQVFWMSARGGGRGGETPEGQAQEAIWGVAGLRKKRCLDVQAHFQKVLHISTLAEASLLPSPTLNTRKSRSGDNASRWESCPSAAP